MELIFRGLTHFNNTNSLDIGDTVIAFPYSMDIFKKNNQIRKATVVEKSIDKLLLIDLDKREMFYWDLDCNITDTNFITFIINRA